MRVHVIEAHQLPGGNLNPLVKVICCDKTKRTMSVKGTNRPYFDEVCRYLIDSPASKYKDTNSNDHIELLFKGSKKQKKIPC